MGAQTANWSAEEGKSVMETVLKANNNDIQIVFAQNDEMGLGAALAVEEAGLVPGKDVKIATIDGTKGAMEALAAGRLSFVAEYNPLFGDTAVDIVGKALAGEQVESYIIVPSDVFDSPEAAQEALPDPQVLTRRTYGAAAMDSDPGTGQPHQGPEAWTGPEASTGRSGPESLGPLPLSPQPELRQTVLATREAPT